MLLETNDIGELCRRMKGLGFHLVHGGDSLKSEHLFEKHFKDESYIVFRWTGEWTPLTLAERGLVKIGGRRIHDLSIAFQMEYKFERTDGSVVKLEVRELFDDDRSREHLETRAGAHEEYLRSARALLELMDARGPEAARTGR